jgi:hypothetical protein
MSHRARLSPHMIVRETSSSATPRTRMIPPATVSPLDQNEHAMLAGASTRRVAPAGMS